MSLGTRVVVWTNYFVNFVVNCIGPTNSIVNFAVNSIETATAIQVGLGLKPGHPYCSRFSSRLISS